jgi:hypothetical protein
MLSNHRFTTAAAVALALGVASPALAQQQDLRSPDTKDAAECGSIAQCGERPPDLRTPDAIDAASPTTTPSPTRVRIVEVPSNGFEWGDAGIGAAGALAVVALGAGVGMAGAQRRRSRQVSAGTR